MSYKNSKSSETINPSKINKPIVGKYKKNKEGKFIFFNEEWNEEDRGE